MARQTLDRAVKFKRLVLELDLPKPYVRGLLETLWDVAHECGDPVIGTTDDVEAAAEWPGDPGQFVAALARLGWIDEVDGAWEIHDYWDHAPDYVRKRRQREIERHERADRLRTTADNGRQRRTMADNGRTPTPAPTPNTQHMSMFSEWWARYPKKIDRKKCERFFLRISQADRDAAAGDGYRAWLDHWLTIDQQYVPNPYTWLNNRRWEAAPPVPRKPNPASTHATHDEGDQWMYDTYRRADYEAHHEDSRWPAYAAFAAECQPRTAPAFAEWGKDVAP
jgi:hypothetical protein